MTDPQKDPQQIVIVTGMSGSGKHTVFKALEDLGYFCVDNLPPALLPKLIEMGRAAGGGVSRLAVVTDIRSGETLADFESVYDNLKKSRFNIQVVFVDASDEVLARRYSETRRVHPLAQGRGVLEGVRSERHQIASLKALCDLLIDTSHTSVHELKHLIQQTFASDSDSQRPQITFLSFGFKYGLPFNADLVLDVRFLPNPYFDPDLKELRGDDPAMEAFFQKEPETEESVERIAHLLRYLVPRYRREGKNYLTIGIGCTGGRHRSVYVCQELSRVLRQRGLEPIVQHRDVHKDEFQQSET